MDEDYPTMNLMTGLNGYFDEPGLDGSGEALLKAEPGEDVVVWASRGRRVPIRFAGSGNSFFGEVKRLYHLSRGSVALQKSDEARVGAQRVEHPVDLQDPERGFLLVLFDQGERLFFIAQRDIDRG